MSFSLSTSAGPYCVALDLTKPENPLPPQGWLPDSVAPSASAVGKHRPIGRNDLLNHQVGSAFLNGTLKVHHQLQQYTLANHPRLFRALEDRFERYSHLISRSNKLLCGPLPGEDRETLRNAINQGRAANAALTALLTQAHDPRLETLLHEMATSALSAGRLVSQVQGPWPNGLRRHGDPHGLDDLIWSMDRAETMEDCQHARRLLDARVGALSAEFLMPPPPPPPLPRWPVRSNSSSPDARLTGSTSALGQSAAWTHDPPAQGGTGTGTGTGAGSGAGAMKRPEAALRPSVPDPAWAPKFNLAPPGQEPVKVWRPQARTHLPHSALVADVMQQAASDMAAELYVQREVQMEAQREAQSEAQWGAHRAAHMGGEPSPSPRWRRWTDDRPPTSSQGTSEGR